MTAARVRVEPCGRCPTMKPIGAKYHAPLLRERDEMKCKHGEVYWSDCAGRIQPPCCWNEETSDPTERKTKP